MRFKWYKETVQISCLCGKKWQAENIWKGQASIVEHRENECWLSMVEWWNNPQDKRFWREGVSSPRNPKATLDCKFCPEETRPWFETFDALARHVRTRHRYIDQEIRARNGDLLVPKEMEDPDDFHGDGMPEAEEGDYPTFIKPHHLGGRKTVQLVLVGVSDRTSDFSDVILDITFNGKPYVIGLKLFSEDYKGLLKRFGKKREAWTGKLTGTVRPYKGGSYVAIK